MRILIVGDYKPQVGGPANVVQNLAPFLSKEHQISVINIEERPYQTGLGQWLDGAIKVWQEKRYFLGNLIVVPAVFQKTKRAFLLRNKVDLYHAHCPSDAFIGLIDRSKPLVLTLHGYPTLEVLSYSTIKSNSLKFKVLKWMEKNTIQQSDAIIVVGKKLKTWVVDEFGADPHKVFYVPNGINIKDFSPITLQRSIDLVNKYNLENKHCILFSKHFTPRYGAEFLVRALPEVIKKYPNTVCIMTNDDSGRENIVALAKAIGVYDNIIFPGRVSFDELVGLYQVSDIYVHPSINDQETFGIALIEAMVCGKPVVATAVGGPKEILEGKENVGILIPPKDPHAIANAVIELIGDPVKAEKMGENARRYVESTYTWERASGETLQVYEYATESHANKYQ